MKIINDFNKFNENIDVFRGDLSGGSKNLLGIKDKYKNQSLEDRSDLENIFLPIKDLGVEDIRIWISNNLEVKNRLEYGISWYFTPPINNLMSKFNRSKPIDLDTLNRSKKSVNVFGEMYSESCDIIERLISMGYDLYEFKVDYEVDFSGDSSIDWEFNIYLGRNLEI